VEPLAEARSYPYWLGVPMVAGTETVGALVLRSRQKPFSSLDERMLGEVASMVGIAFRDARLYEELMAARDVLGVIAGTREGLVAADPRGRVVYYSSAAAAITGHSEGDARGRYASELGGTRRRRSWPG
jgi:GAF domain-containing protein